MRGKRQGGRFGALTLVGFIIVLLAGCGTWIHDDIPDGDLKGVVLVQWTSEDFFVYWKTNNKNPLKFQPSFLAPSNLWIEPENIVTDGGSIPRVFWGIPGLSPWGLGPAYVIHDYLFIVHRCGWTAPAYIKQITFEQSAEVLAEVGKALIEHGLVRDDMLDAIVWAVRTNYARGLWDTPLSPTDRDCQHPIAPRARPTRNVIEFEIPPKLVSLRAR
jgi:hypothetical protein